ncbi:MAG TPA: hypothetical protein VJG30_03420 [Candidatus Nanoarchaeia archaeon]|nr:hypothetical protein [Candidatus Nanoarchaeia archaeon]
MTESSQQDREGLDTRWVEKHTDSRDHCATLEEEATIGYVHAKIVLREKRFHELAVVETEAVAPNGIVFNFGARTFRENYPRSPLWSALPYVKAMERAVIDYFEPFFLNNKAA